ncbi:S8 family serine peptidase [Paracoccus beibuensis]|uniref:S8 family serine peptidase n=1 Tax=Paracoccus beibuensis TaxID=547602 RepID=UPI00223EAE8F|nr:S8 family serine peptidase [Paracoccus beibuensis]
MPRQRTPSCGSGATIGMVDTGINKDHETFQGARLDLHNLGPAQLDPSQQLHGTAVAALLVGDPATRAPGLVPAARLVAVDAFHRVGTDERADVFSLLRAIDLLVEREIGVLNLSLAGPDNDALAGVVTDLVTQRDIVVVSAVSNEGPTAPPAYPAAYDPVIAVTAVDGSKRVYRRAVRGPHVELAAPGVNVWTAASVSGARWKTGTSFAAPFVTAAAAILRENRPNLPAAEVKRVLREKAADLGAPDHDPVYGAGLLSIAELCDAAPRRCGRSRFGEKPRRAACFAPNPASVVSKLLQSKAMGRGRVAAGRYCPHNTGKLRRLVNEQGRRHHPGS